MVDVVSTPPSAVSDDGEDRSQVSGGKSSSLRYAYKDDQWSPVNPSGKKAYDRNFLLELQNNPASMKKPDGLPSLEVVRDKVMWRENHACHKFRSDDNFRRADIIQLMNVVFLT